LLHKSKNKNARKRVMRQARKQADKQRRESAPDLFLDGLEDDLVLGGALLVADAFTYNPSVAWAHLLQLPTTLRLLLCTSTVTT
jgi:hypothetical protein